ncbi:MULTISPECIES: hypothetical protein [Parafrankia]|uniref:hypothetical protein n=1 Tax=Parafrankia TaxID=2994362 RepID=UPI000B8602F5|nr:MULTISPECIES: hypothetical protein [Parafrankia]MBE3199704.1 hypothetical protein [Parafrankia sp. CH37]
MASPYGVPQKSIPRLVLVNLLESGDADGAEQLVLRHVSAVESRALVRGPETRPQDLTVILSRY